MNRLRLDIILLCISVSVEYGVLHDLVTAQFSRKYFTVGHTPPFWLPCDRFTLAMFFGVTSSWWVGLVFGVFLAQGGKKLHLTKVFWVLQRMCLLGFFVAMLGGLFGGCLASAGLLQLPVVVEARLQGDGEVLAFLIAASAHIAAYLYWFVTGSILVYGIHKRLPWAEILMASEPHRV